MSYSRITPEGLNYAPCRYGTSRQFFRGPRRPIEGPFFTFVGGAETYGKYIERPFPELVEEQVGRICVNLGVVNGSIDSALNDPTVMGLCEQSTQTIIEITGAQNISNRFYTVHPRRNDRFLEASSILRALYPEVDFTNITFTRHLLRTLFDSAPERFEIVQIELQHAWTARMREVVAKLNGQVVLLWMSDHTPKAALTRFADAGFVGDPLFVTQDMIDEVSADCADVVFATASPAALTRRLEGMVVPAGEETVAGLQLGPAAHVEVAEMLGEVLSAYTK